MHRQRIKYLSPPTDENFTHFLRQYRLDSLLKKINQESSNLLMQYDNEITNGVKRTSILLFDSSKKKKFPCTFYIQAWKLIDLAYEAILRTHDHRGISDISQDELYLSAFVTNELYTSQENKLLPEFQNSQEDFMFYLWGFSGEQIKFQELNIVHATASRELYILFESSKKVPVKIDIAGIVQNQLGTNWETVIAIIYLLWFSSTQTSFVLDIEDHIIWDTELSKELFESVLQKYTVTYNDVKSSPLKRQIFYTKPFVQTSRGEIISINCYLNLFLYEHAITWIVRDFYKQKDDQAFTAYFGKCFESYVQELLETYLHTDEYQRIVEGPSPRADWFLNLGQHKFLIEQKSAFLSLSAKQQDSDYNATRKYADNTILKALKQLDATQNEFGLDSCIKIVLLYENYLNPHVLDTIFLSKTCPVKNDDNYWLITIDEFEMLLHTYATDKNTFEKIFHEKENREHSHSTDGKDLKLLFGKFNINENTYLASEKFIKYGIIAPEIARTHLKNK